VLLDESVGMLVTDPAGIYVDGTAGAGGHSEAIAASLKGGGCLICLDRDPDAVAAASERLKAFGSAVEVVRANFADLDKILEGRSVGKVSGILLDLGMSSLQIEGSGRGFSFLREEALDMRMDPESEITAYGLVNELPQEDLERILREYGEERKAKAIARAIVKEREAGAIRDSLRLAQIVSRVIPTTSGRGIHPATRTFQALRIAVNRELELLKEFLDKAPDLIATGGRLVVIAYHSLEDRMIKGRMAQWERPCTCPTDLPSCVCGKRPLFRRVNKRAIRPTAAEIESNRRSRSAVLRVAERVAS
jgi:16S rRNA (cytosine1402-N4)-methyltransferase